MKKEVPIIPIQLKEYRFIKLKQNDVETQKQPAGMKWPENHLDYQTAIDKMNGDKTYGVMCGVNNLIVVDCDEKSFQDSIEMNSTLSNTLKSKTAGKGLYHYFFEIDIDQKFEVNPKYPKQPKGFKIDDRNGNRVADVQGSGTQVVGPGSTMMDGRKYELVNDKPIQKISYHYLKDLLQSCGPSYVITSMEHTERTEYDPILQDPQAVAIKAQIKVSHLLDFIEDKNIPNSFHTKCPFHTSVGEKCIHITDNEIWHCHHCQRGGDVISLKKYLNGDDNFVKAKYDLMKTIGLATKLQKDVMTLLASSDKKQKDRAYEMLAEEFTKLYHVKTIRSDDKQEVWIYDRGLYVPNGKTYIRTFLYDLVGPISTVPFDKRVIDLITKTTNVEAVDFFNSKYPSKLPVLNGVLNTVSKELEPFSPKYIFFNKLPVSFDPVLSQPENFLDFLKATLKDEEDNMVIQEMFGYCLYRSYKWQKAFLLEGSGSNGKSVLCRVLESMLGNHNVSNLTLQSLETDKFMLGGLHNKLANIDADLPNKTLEYTNKFKAATGEDTIDVDRKFKDLIKVKNYAKMIFGCNTVPKTKDTSEGFMRRWVVVRFPYRFTDKIVNPNDKIAIVNIIEKLTTDKELNSILLWSLDGLERLIKNNRFTSNQGTTQIRNFWKRKSSIVGAFIEDELEIVEDGLIEKTIFVNRLKDYAGKEPLPKWIEIRNELEENGLMVDRKTRSGTKMTFIIGARLKGELADSIPTNRDETEINLETID